MNAAFEDCVLDECLSAYHNDRRKAFMEYFIAAFPNPRRSRGANFVEMRDKTASRLRAKKKLHTLEGWLPRPPLYAMVTFSMPYAEAA